MAKLNDQEVTTLLREYAGRSALRGGNPYPWKAYARAADSQHLYPLDRLIAEERLKKSRVFAMLLRTTSPNCAPRAPIPALKK